MPTEYIHSRFPTEKKRGEREPALFILPASCSTDATRVTTSTFFVSSTRLSGFFFSLFFFSSFLGNFYFVSEPFSFRVFFVLFLQQFIELKTNWLMGWRTSDVHFALNFASLTGFLRGLFYDNEKKRKNFRFFPLGSDHPLYRLRPVTPVWIRDCVSVPVCL